VSDDERSLEIWKDKHAGLVSSTTVDGIPVVAYGGSEQERTDALNAANDVLTKTDRGKSMAEALKHRVETHWVGKDTIKPLELILVHGSSGLYSEPGKNFIWMPIGTGTNGQVGGAYPSATPGGTISYSRAIAHELGHAAIGILDLNFRTMSWMQNVDMNETPAMHQLGDYNDRVSYGWK